MGQTLQWKYGDCQTGWKTIHELGMDKQNVFYLYNRMSSTTEMKRKKKRKNTSYKLDKSQKHYTLWKKSDTKDSIYKKFPEKKNIERQISDCLELEVEAGTDFKWAQENIEGKIF